MTNEEAKQVIEYLIDNDPAFRDKYTAICVSDERMKQLAMQDSFTPEDTAFIMEQLGIANDDYDNNTDDSVLDDYAEHLRNYLYRYKPEAARIDSSINPDEEQIGIMAQDLEQVNPACVKELPDGTKTVDTGKLALMNAGAIADIVRRLQTLEGEVYGIRKN